jgi:hypothetical protein
MVATITNYDPVLKAIFPSKSFEALAESLDPFIGLVNTKTDFEGSECDVPVAHGTNQSVGTTIATALAAADAMKSVKFRVIRGRYYGTARIEHELVLAAKKNKAAFVDGLQTAVRDTLETLRMELGRQIYGNFGGARGQILAGVATPTITLTNRRDVRFFQRGMVLQTDITNGTAGGAPNPGTVTVANVNPTLGTVTIAGGGNWTDAGNIPLAAAGDFLFRNNDFGQCMYGLDSWNPVIAPVPGDAHFSVDRSVNVTYLSGLRMTAVAPTIAEALIDGMAEMNFWGQHPDYCLMNSIRWHELAKELGTAIVRDDSIKSKRAGIGYQGIVLVGPGGECRVLPSFNCPYGVARLITSDTWTLGSLGTMPDLLQYPTQGYLRVVENTDQLEARLGWYGQAWCDKPVANMVITL